MRVSLQVPQDDALNSGGQAPRESDSTHGPAPVCRARKTTPVAAIAPPCRPIVNEHCLGQEGKSCTSTGMSKIPLSKLEAGFPRFSARLYCVSVVKQSDVHQSLSMN